MSFTNWLAVVASCCLGAMSPGPSTVVVIKNTIVGGRRNGMMTALGHGIGVGIYAFLCVAGLGVLITRSPFLYSGLQLFGAGYLGWLGGKTLLDAFNSQEEAADQASETHQTTQRGFRAGFLIAFLNPKIAIFFLALFSQFIAPGSPVWQKVLYALTAAVIDGAWYAIVAMAFSIPRMSNRLQASKGLIDRAFGGLLILVAARMFWGVVAGS